MRGSVYTLGLQTLSSELDILYRLYAQLHVRNVGSRSLRLAGTKRCTNTVSGETRACPGIDV